jgi:hypothetical protein
MMLARTRASLEWYPTPERFCWTLPTQILAISAIKSTHLRTIRARGQNLNGMEQLPFIAQVSAPSHPWSPSDLPTLLMCEGQRSPKKLWSLIAPTGSKLHAVAVIAGRSLTQNQLARKLRVSCTESLVQQGPSTNSSGLNKYISLGDLYQSVVKGLMRTENEGN